MRSPVQMEIIQIDITNACVHRCSNCTRFCGHHKKNFFMDYETFKKAVDSLEDYPGIVGVMGGEPTLHPEFERFALYINQNRLKSKITKTRGIISNFNDYYHQNLFPHLDQGCKVGLWSSVSSSYYKHFELINENFDYQALNDHENTCMHQALLMARKDLGIDDEEFFKLRDKCWVQNLWSATITPKGAFFCEIAGALDMLFNGSGGWPIEKGWWRRKPEEFGDQLQWCELCSCCLDVPKRLSTEGKDDVSPTLAKMLREVQSPKANNDKIIVHNLNEYKIFKADYKAFQSSTAYMDDNNSIRIRNTKTLLPHKFLYVADNTSIKEIPDHSINDWLIIPGALFPKFVIKKFLANKIINPGVCYVIGDSIVFNTHSSALRSYEGNISKISLLKIYPDDKIYTVSSKELLQKIYKKLKRTLKSKR